MKLVTFRKLEAYGLLMLLAAAGWQLFLEDAARSIVLNGALTAIFDEIWQVAYLVDGVSKGEVFKNIG